MNRSKQGLNHAEAAVAIVVIILIVAVAYVGGYLPNKQSGVNPSTGVTTNSQGQVINSYYIGSSWQANSGGATTATVSLQRWAGNNLANPYFSSGTMTSQYTISNNAFNISRVPLH